MGLWCRYIPCSRTRIPTCAFNSLKTDTALGCNYGNWNGTDINTATWNTLPSSDLLNPIRFIQPTLNRKSSYSPPVYIIHPPSKSHSAQLHWDYDLNRHRTYLPHANQSLSFNGIAMDQNVIPILAFKNDKCFHPVCLYRFIKLTLSMCLKQGLICSLSKTIA